MHNIQNLWNQRAERLGDLPQSVMEQSFPVVVNTHIHTLHMRELLAAMPSGAKRILDVGCGWGRIAEDIVKKHRDAKISGIDLSEHFVKLFNRRMKGREKAVVADMRNLPFKMATFDFVYCVTSLMYLSSKKDQKQAISEMLRVMKKCGRLVLIEPNALGVHIVRLGGLIPFMYRTLLQKPKVETFGTAFRLKEIQSFINRCGGTVVSRRGYPFLTLLLLPTIVVGTVLPAVAKAIFWFAFVLDGLFPFAMPSYFVIWVISKNRMEER